MDWLGLLVIAEVPQTLQLQKKLERLQARTLLIGSCLCVDWLGRLLRRLYVLWVHDGMVNCYWCAFWMKFRSFLIVVTPFNLRFVCVINFDSSVLESAPIQNFLCLPVLIVLYWNQLVSWIFLVHQSLMLCCVCIGYFVSFLLEISLPLSIYQSLGILLCRECAN